MNIVKKNYKPHQERRAIGKHFCYAKTLPLLIKLEKTNSDFCFNFCVGEADTKDKGGRDKYSVGEALEHFEMHPHKHTNTYIL